MLYLSDSIVICLVVFGAEPKDYLIYEWVLANFYSLNFSKPTPNKTKIAKKVNPKRIQRQISQEISKVGLSNKSQDAIKKQYEESKIASKKRKQIVHELEKQKHFILKQQKKKQKHKGH